MVRGDGGSSNPMRQRQRELGWSDDEAASRTGIEVGRYLSIAGGAAAPGPREIEQLVDAMALVRRDLAEWMNRPESGDDSMGGRPAR